MAAELYKQDFYAWTRQQAAALRRLADERWNGPLDLVHLSEEIADLGEERRNAVRSHLRRIIEHCLKLEHSPAVEPHADWKGSIVNARSEIGDRLTTTIRNDMERELPALYAQALRAARLALSERGESEAAETLPENGPYVLAQLLADDWYSASRHRITDSHMVTRR